MDLRAYRDRVQDWWRQNAARASTKSAYYLLAASAFLPLLAEPDFRAAAVALVGGVGGNLLADIVAQAREAAGSRRKAAPDAQQLLDAVLEGAHARSEVREALDMLLAQSGAVLATRESLRDDWQAFAGNLLAEVAQWGDSPQIREIVSNISVTGGGVVAGRDQHFYDSYVAGRDLIINNYFDQRQARAALNLYLTGVLEQRDELPLLSEGKHPEWENIPARLSGVYTAMDAIHAARGIEESARARTDDAETREATGLVPLLEVANAYRRLALIGDAGTGKSAFASFLCLCMAGELRAPGSGGSASLAALNRAFDTKGKTGEPAWKHGALLPLFVPLRRFADPESGCLPAEPAEVSSDCLLKYLQERLVADLDFRQTLRGFLTEREGARVLLVLDGLDEVDDEQRDTVRRIISAFARRFSGCRIVVTSRRYAYEEAEEEGRIRLDRFQRADLAPLSDAQISRFAHQWYVATERDQPEEKAREWAQSLDRELTGDLRDIARRPLLLTVTAIVHRVDKKLPQNVARLYERIVELLVNKWNQHKEEKTLEAELGTGLASLHKMLQRLAFQVHAANEPSVSGARLLAQISAVCGDDAKANRIVRQLDRRAGILVGRGGPTPDRMEFEWPHRNFQEYLAARAIIGQSKEIAADAPALADQKHRWFPTNLRALFEQDSGQWREVVFWAAENRALDDAPNPLWELVRVMCPHIAPPVETVREKMARDETECLAALLMAQTLNKYREKYAEAQDEHAQERVRGWLRRALEAGALSVADRAAAGRALNFIGIGDDRPGVCDFDAAMWVTIPAGPFLMGNTKETDPKAYDSGQSQRTVELPAYRISRYPVTNAQYAAFVKDGGYTEKWRSCWTEAGWAWKGDREGPDNDLPADDLLPNHPRVNVSWYEAHAFTQWLGAKLGYEVRLPREAEWEKAARGIDGRRYPWGDAFDASRCNARETGIRQTSAVGMFPLPDGPWEDNPLDMSGNVWEWCQSQYRGYPYDAGDGREEVDISDSDTTPRVLRGGAFLDERLVRCACRHWYLPSHFYRHRGFRVCAPSGLPL